MRDHRLAATPKWEPLTELFELNAVRDLVSALVTHNCCAYKVRGVYVEVGWGGNGV